MEYKTIEAGVVGGSRAELSLKYERKMSSADTRLSHLEGEELQRKSQRDRLRLVKGALGAATCLTGIDAGTLQPLQTSQTSMDGN